MWRHFLIPIIAALLCPLNCRACDCISLGNLEQQVAAEWNASTAVVVARVISVSTRSGLLRFTTDEHEQQVPIKKQMAKWRIIRSWKGTFPVGSLTTTETTTTCCLCGQEVTIGEVRLLYLGSNRPYEVSQCSVGGRLKESESQIPLLEKLQKSHK